MGYEYWRIRSYDDALECMRHARNQRDGRPIDNHTRLLWGSNRSLCIRFHKTDVLTYYENGDLDVYNGGWFTKTTRERIESYSTVRLGTYDGRWTLHWHNRSWIYADCRLFRDQRREPVLLAVRDTLDGHGAHPMPLAKYQREEARKRELLKSFPALARELVELDLWQALGGALECRVLSKIIWLETEFLNHLDRHVEHGIRVQLAKQAEELQLAQSCRAEGKELRPIVLRGGKL